MRPFRIAAGAAALACGLAGGAGAARLDVAGLGLFVRETVVLGGSYLDDRDPGVGLVSVTADGAGTSVTINGVPPFTAADFDILVETLPAAAGDPSPALLGAASLLGDDGAAGFDLLFEALEGRDGASLRPGDALLARVAYDTVDDPGAAPASGAATVTLSVLAPIPLPAGGALLLSALALAFARRPRRA